MRGIGDQLLSLKFGEVDLFLLHLTCGAAVAALSPHNFACPIKILHPQSKISPLELSLSGFLRLASIF